MTLHAGRGEAGITGFGDRIGVVDLDGVILLPQPVVGQLKKFGDDSSIKAIILHVNSPAAGWRLGGDLSRGQADSQREEEAIVASIETVGRAGRIMWRRLRDKIFGGSRQYVGSIGVIAQWVNYGDLLKWAELKDVVIKTGEFKDTGNPARDLTPTERGVHAGLIDTCSGNLCKAVSEWRGMKFDNVE